MSTYAEQPFTDFEERYFLAEILKRSALPPAHLLHIIREAGIDPAWNDIALPNGRSVSACQQAYAALFARNAAQPPQVNDPSRRLKRPFSSMGDATSILPRELQPRPPAFATINGQQMPLPPPVTMTPIEPQRKKRGRPTKTEFEKRQQEARARGEIWPKPRKPKARPSTESTEASGSANMQKNATAVSEPGGGSAATEESSASQAEIVTVNAPVVSAGYLDPSDIRSRSNQLGSERPPAQQLESTDLGGSAYLRNPTQAERPVRLTEDTPAAAREHGEGHGISRDSGQDISTRSLLTSQSSQTYHTEDTRER